MLTLINNIIDRCFFTAAFILGVQLPEFIKQYLQRLAGHLDEAQAQLAQFQQIAQQHFDGSLVTMISRYKSNTESSIISTGELIERLVARAQYLQLHFEQISTVDYINQLYQMFLHFDAQIAQATLVQFSMAIPLKTDALLTGATIAISSLILKALFMIAIRYPFRPKKAELI
jgi:hypothetical protein